MCRVWEEVCECLTILDAGMDPCAKYDGGLVVNQWRLRRHQLGCHLYLLNEPYHAVRIETRYKKYCLCTLMEPDVRGTFDPPVKEPDYIWTEHLSYRTTITCHGAHVQRRLLYSSKRELKQWWVHRNTVCFQHDYSCDDLGMSCDLSAPIDDMARHEEKMAPALQRYLDTLTKGTPPLPALPPLSRRLSQTKYQQPWSAETRLGEKAHKSVPRVFLEDPEEEGDQTHYFTVSDLYHAATWPVRWICAAIVRLLRLLWAACCWLPGLVPWELVSCCFLLVLAVLILQSIPTVVWILGTSAAVISRLPLVALLSPEPSPPLPPNPSAPQPPTQQQRNPWQDFGVQPWPQDRQGFHTQQQAPMTMRSANTARRCYHLGHLVPPPDTQSIAVQTQSGSLTMQDFTASRRQRIGSRWTGASSSSQLQPQPPSPPRRPRREWFS